MFNITNILRKICICNVLLSPQRTAISRRSEEVIKQELTEVRENNQLFPDILKIRYTAADFGRRREFRYSAAEKFLYVADGIRKK